MNQRKAFPLISAIVGLFAICLVILKPYAPNISAVGPQGSIGVYWDRSCTSRVSSIDWGVLSPGSTEEVVVYVRNEGNTSFILYLTTGNWTPVDASGYLSFSWNSELEKLAMGSIVRVAQDLFVSVHVHGITSFSFDIIFEARDYYVGDINKDGIVEISDVATVAFAYGATPTHPRWNPDADVNKDGVTNMNDVSLVAREYGQT